MKNDPNNAPGGKTKTSEPDIYSGNPPRNNQNRGCSISQTKNVSKSGGSMYNGPSNLDEKSKTR